MHTRLLAGQQGKVKGGSNGGKASRRGPSAEKEPWYCPNCPKEFKKNLTGSGHSQAIVNHIATCGVRPAGQRDVSAMLKKDKYG